MNIIHLDSSNIGIWNDKIHAYLQDVGNSEIQMLYQNPGYTMQRLAAGAEQSFLAEEGGRISGMLAAFSNMKKTVWNLILLHVTPERRLDQVGTALVSALEQELASSVRQFRITAQCKVSDKYSNIFYLSKDFRFEGWCRAVEEADDMYVWAKIHR